MENERYSNLIMIILVVYICSMELFMFIMSLRIAKNHSQRIHNIPWEIVNEMGRRQTDKNISIHSHMPHITFPRTQKL